MKSQLKLSRANCMHHSDAASQGGGWWQGGGAAHPTPSAQQIPISYAIWKTETAVARKAIAVEIDVNVTATAPAAKRSMNAARGSEPFSSGRRRYLRR